MVKSPLVKSSPPQESAVRSSPPLETAVTSPPSHYTPFHMEFPCRLCSKTSGEVSQLKRELDHNAYYHYQRSKTEESRAKKAEEDCKERIANVIGETESTERPAGREEC
jgi:hypothetical protein